MLYSSPVHMSTLTNTSGLCSLTESGLEIRIVKSKRGQELYATISPGSPAELGELLERVCEIAATEKMRVCHHRSFLPELNAPRYETHVRRVLGPNTPGAWMRAPGGMETGGVQVRAVGGVENWQALTCCMGVGGWAFEQGGRKWAVTGGMHGRIGSACVRQVSEAFARGEFLLDQAVMTLHDVARTWIYMDDILAWYGELNTERNRIFIESGLLVKGEAAERSRVPASTGMGVSPLCGARIGVEFFAATGVEVKRYAAAGKQRSAYEYGSAFARAAECETPGGKTLFVSGTAAIDPAGVTCHLDDVDGQISMTLANVHAILKQTDYASSGVVQAIAYCKTPEVVEAFRTRFQEQWNWPWLIVIGDVCRDNLLFEVEVTACKPD